MRHAFVTDPEPMEIKVEQYRNPARPLGFHFMAHSDAIEAAGIFGFGSSEQEAIADFHDNLALEQQ